MDIKAPKFIDVLTLIAISKSAKDNSQKLI